MIFGRCYTYNLTKLYKKVNGFYKKSIIVDLADILGCRVWNAQENSSDRAFGFERKFTSEGLAVIPQESTARFFSFEEKDGIIITQSVIIKEFRLPVKQRPAFSCR